MESKIMGQTDTAFQELEACTTDKERSMLIIGSGRVTVRSRDVNEPTRKKILFYPTIGNYIFLSIDSQPDFEYTDPVDALKMAHQIHQSLLNEQ